VLKWTFINTLGASMQKWLGVGLLLAGMVANCATAASANCPCNCFVFGDSGGAAHLDVCTNAGVVQLQAVDQGWVSTNGSNHAGLGDCNNSNYIAGACFGETLRDFFTFCTSSLGKDTINSADLVLCRALTFGSGCFDLHLSPATLTGVVVSPCGALFGVLGSGCLVGTYNVSGTCCTCVDLPFNSVGLAALDPGLVTFSGVDPLANASLTPEVDGSAAAAPLALLGGCLLLATDRRSKKQRV
jgi:hypothetical protein